MKRVILFDYFHYCATMISKFYRGYLVRNEIRGFFNNRRQAKQIIMKYIMSFKIRFVLRSAKVQDLLIEIATVKHILNKLQIEEPSEKSERLHRELSRKLPGLQLSFYEEFYLMKKKKWASHVKVNTHWFDSFMKNLINPEENTIQNLGKNNYEHLSTPKADRISINERRAVDVDDYDNRPIKGSGMGAYNLEEYPEYKDEAASKEKKRPDRIRKKAPKYDARKAIEVAKNKESEDKPKGKDKGGLRNFLKSMRDGTKNDEGDMKVEVVADVIKEEKNNEVKDNKKTQEKKKATRANRKNIELRQKLHEMEKSPPPRVLKN
jgi:hypothetical protein